MAKKLTPEEESAAWAAVDAIRRGEAPNALSMDQREYLLDRLIDTMVQFKAMSPEEQAFLLEQLRLSTDA